MTKSENSVTDKNTILALALLRASNQLGLTDSEIAKTIGKPIIAIEDLKNDPKIEPTSKEGKKSLFLIQIAQRLYALMGGEQAMMKRFMRCYNKHTYGVPAEQISSTQGLMSLVQYLNAISK